MSDEHQEEFGLVMPFWIDTDAYSDRDRLLFCAGYEFCQFMTAIDQPEEFRTTIHRENESRFRMAAAKRGRAVSIEACELQYDPDGSWSYLRLAAADLRG